MKKAILIMLGIIFGNISNAQQELILTKYTYNPMFFNPAYAGSHGLGEGSLLGHYRNQWLGLDGAPTTFMLGAEVSAFDNKVGLGLNVSSESIGVFTNTDLSGSVAYRIQLSTGQISGGLRFGFTNYQNDFDKLTIKDPTDIFDDNSYAYSAITAGAGLYYNTDDLYIGISVPALARVSASRDIGDRTQHLYFHTGFMIGDEYSTIKFEPSLLLKYEQSVPLQYTLGVNAWFTDDFAIGGHYRSTDALALSLEWHFLEKYRLAIAYDFTTSDIRHYSSGSLEALFGYRFNISPDNPKVKNLRYGGRF